MLQFMRNLIGVKADKAVQAGVEALVRWDPQSASEAEMRSMEQHLDELGQQVARARQSYDKETREADAIQSLSTQRMAAAEHLQSQAGGGNRSGEEGRVGAQPDDAGDDARADGARGGPRKEGRRSMPRTSSRCWRRPTPTPAASCARAARSSSARSATWHAPVSSGRWPSSRLTPHVALPG